MQRYRTRKCDVGVEAYDLHKTAIDIEFHDGSLYHYDYNQPGPEKVENMKRLAVEGEGLSTYINQHVRGAYAYRVRSRSRR